MSYFRQSDVYPDARTQPEGARHADCGDVLADLRTLSAGNIGRVGSAGPVLARRPAERRRLGKVTLEPALSRHDRVLMAVLALGWATCLTIFWAWWLNPVHRISAFGFFMNSVVIAYVSCFPVLFVAAVIWLRKVSPVVRVPALRVAFVVTRAPAEPWEMARATLTAMLGQHFPGDFDVWLCDERPDDAVMSWCRSSGVSVSTRHGAEDYHRQNWPRRTRCKEGNLAYFYDHWGYRLYDVVVQLDCDHRPARTYLAEMVRPFADPSVGYVAAPSICDANASASWSARGRVNREAPFHGPFQLGHSGGLAPVCIGSHYAVRTTALRGIGGIGPELAEDFSTTFLLNAAGWQGVFAIDAEAHGDGPETFVSMAVQEFQWSRSLTTILIGLLPGNILRLPWSLRARFLYPLTYYVVLATTSLVGVALAPIAVLTGVRWVDVNYVAFIAHWWPIPVWLILMIVLLRRRGMLRPRSAPVVSWESWLYTFARWPYIACGVGAAILSWIRPRPVTFKITPKREDGVQSLPVRAVAPYAAISLVSAATALMGERFTTNAGYVFLCLLAAAMYGLVVTAIPILHGSEASAKTGLPLLAALRLTARGPAMLGAATLAAAIAAIAGFPAYVIPLLGGRI